MHWCLSKSLPIPKRLLGWMVLQPLFAPSSDAGPFFFIPNRFERPLRGGASRCYDLDMKRYAVRIGQFVLFVLLFSLTGFVDKVIGPPAASNGVFGLFLSTIPHGILAGASFLLICYLGDKILPPPPRFLTTFRICFTLFSVLLPFLQILVIAYSI
jgi:hypothetical protein